MLCHLIAPYGAARSAEAIRTSTVRPVGETDT
jgi:hypothetical protein